MEISESSSSFVLSGFLISYLLLEEKERSGGISVRRFYARRALRIWPLYYLVVISALYALPYCPTFQRPDIGIQAIHENLGLKSVLYLTFFANVVLANVGLVPYASHTWFIDTEEQFYFIWPILLKWAQRIAGVMVTVIIGYVAVSHALASGILGSGALQSEFQRFLSLFNVDCMAIGGLAAIALHRKSKLLSLLVNLRVFCAALVTTIICISQGYSLPYLNYEFYSTLFAVLILNLATHQKLARVLEFEPIHYLGTISYGLYMLHPIAIVASIRVLGDAGLLRDTLLYPTAALVAIGLASLSYHLLEAPFLRWKSRLATLPSGDVARPLATARPRQ